MSTEPTATTQGAEPSPGAPTGEYPVVVLHNTATDRYHPMYYRHAPPPSGDVGPVRRYRSGGHHTEGFASLSEALDHVRGEPRFGWTGLVWDWDGTGSPHGTEWFGPPRTTTTPDAPAVSS